MRDLTTTAAGSAELLIEELLSLSHELGSTGRDWAILGEGNTSASLNSDSFLVKASGSQLSSLTARQLVAVRFSPIIAALESPFVYSDSDVKRLLSDAKVSESDGVPSVETILHGFLLKLPGVNFVGHTHIASVNSLLCSNKGWDVMVQGRRIFPDEVVVCGPSSCCVPYVDPGLPLSRALKQSVDQYCIRYGTGPKTIYLQNHGFIALGATADEVVSITKMADKSARIMLGTFAVGGPRFLSPEDVQRIYSRPDEHERQRALGLTLDEPAGQ